MKARALKRIALTLLAVWMICCFSGTDLAATKVSETVKLPVTGMKVTESYASGAYYTKLLTAMKNSAGQKARDRFVMIAKSQEGYKGSSKSTKLAGDGDKGIYTEYSNHRGVAGYDWCAAFVSWCGEAAGLSSSKVLPRSNYAGGKNSSGKAAWADPAGAGTVGTFHRVWSNDFSKYLSDYKPQPGDLCLFMKSSNTWSGTSHVEIVISVNDTQNSDGSWTFTTIGRNGNEVKQSTYKSNAPRSKNSSVRKFKGFYTPNWSAAAAWTASDVSGIVIPGASKTPGKPTLTVSAGTSNTETAFSWAKTSNTEYYTIRIYDSTGAEILLRGGIEGTTFSTQLNAGKYTAKLASVNNTAQEWTFSDVVSFTVAAAAPEPTPGFPGLDPGYAGIYLYNGTPVIVKNGRIDEDAEGLTRDAAHPDDWYYCSAGIVHTEVTQIVPYDTEWFYVKNGKLDTTMAAIVDYNGGKFAVAAGRLLREYNGLIQDPAGSDWYFVASGQAQTQYTGLAQYDGAWFYIVNGKLAVDFVGDVQYDGAWFHVDHGMLAL